MTGLPPRKRIQGTVVQRRIRSKALRAYAYYSIYLPPGYHSSRERYPVVYLFRGHEREWFNPSEDASRKGSSAAYVLERLLRDGRIAPIVLVAPGLVTRDERIHTLGINLYAPQHACHHTGVGTGQFETFLTDEFLPHIESHYRTKSGRQFRAIDGFSLGGYTSMLLIAKHPGLFASAGCYDGTHMWMDSIDVRKGGDEPNDDTWLKNPLFDAAFGSPRNLDYLLQNNPTNIIAYAPKEKKRLLERTAIHIQSANFDGNKGNKHRAIHFESVLKSVGLKNSFARVALHSEATHTWRDADLHLEQSLILHHRVFQQGF